MSAPRIFNERFRRDAKAMISLPFEEIRKYVDKYATDKKFDQIPPNLPYPYSQIVSVLVFVSKDYYDNPEGLKRDLRNSRFTDEEIEKFQTIVSLFHEKGLSQKLRDLSNNYSAERFGYHVLDKVEVMNDFRFRYGNDGKRYLFPVPIYRIMFTDSVENPLVFQSTIAQLDDLIAHLQKVRLSIDKDLNLLKEKGLTEN